MVTQLVLRIILILWLSKELAPAASITTLNCSETCGDVTIPYPFGIGADCSFNEWFEITCNNSFSPPKPFITGINLEVREVFLEEATVRVNSPVISSNCPNRTTGLAVDLIDSPFSFSVTKNRFIATGCNNLAIIKQNQTTIGGCMSICNENTEEITGCYGINCCQTTISASLNYFNASLSSIDSNEDRGGCKSAFMVEQQWFSRYENDISYYLQNMEYVPAVLDWGTSNGTCDPYYGMNSSTANSSIITMPCDPYNAYCSRRQFRPLCVCYPGFQGNPYLPQGCQECVGNHCNEMCLTTSRGYECYTPEDFGKKSRVKVVILGIGAGLGILFLLIGTWWLYKVVKRRKKAMLKKRFFKRNGGLLLQQQLSSGESNVDKTKLFTSKELEKATDHYNENRILGQGGQGTVYKGMLTDGRIVAIKKSKILDEGKLEQFINEVVILSQINHRNVVKILGCCLETEVPLLVYEYIPNGTLFQHIHDQNEEFPVSWEKHLRIATEVAGALSYLHSAASIPIYHRDIKSANILLDDKYRAKVADFGTSKSLAVDQTHFTTLVQGTFGYLDPEYFQSSQFTDKSDVYSFGVVLVELLTGQKPISSTRSQEAGRSLATYFILSMEENRLFDILDARVVKEGGKEEIMAVANLAKKCLDLNGKKRPTMKEVAMELEVIKRSQGGFTIQQNYEEVEYAVTELAEAWNAASTSTRSYLGNSVASSLDVQPLLFNKS